MFAREDALFQQLLAALGHGNGVLQRGLVFLNIGLGFFFVGDVFGDVGFQFGNLPVVDFGVKFEEQLALLNILAFLEIHAQDRRGDTRFHIHRSDGFDVADSVHVERHGCRNGSDCTHGDGRHRGDARGCHVGIALGTGGQAE